MITFKRFNLKSLIHYRVVCLEKKMKIRKRFIILIFTVINNNILYS